MEEKNNTQELFKNVIGHKNQMEEILRVIGWFNNSKELKEKGLSIPKGIIMEGPAGCGKSLIIKEIINNVDAPVFVIKVEDDDNVAASIEKTFENARNVGHAIVVIDELDLLINRDRRVIRALQENLDGVESSDDTLVLAATNDIDEIPYALLRNGRLEKVINIPYPTAQEAVGLFKTTCKKFDVELPKDLDEEELGLSLHRVSFAGIKSIVNDLVLRNGNKGITDKMIDDSIYSITDRVKHSIKEVPIQVAYHEAAHAIMARKYPQFFFINKLTVDGVSGAFHAKEVQENYWTYDKIKADIEICYAGLVAEKLLYQGSRGAEHDLESARISAYNLINKCGYSSCWETLPTIRDDSRTETAIKRRRMERKIERLLRQCEKNTTKYIKSHLEEVKKLGTLLHQKKHLKSSEIIACLG